MSSVTDFLSFRRLMTPYILQILFWGGIGGTLYGTYWLFTHDNWAWWVALIFGTLMTRLIFESAMLRFRTYEALVDIRSRLERMDTTRGAAKSRDYQLQT